VAKEEKEIKSYSHTVIMETSTTTSEDTSGVDVEKQSTSIDREVDVVEEPLAQQRSKLKTISIVAALCLAIFLAALDTVLITTALPTISKDFHISDAGYVWVGSAYLLTNAASVPFWGKISDVFGRKPILLLANVIFLAGSLISALSVSLRMLIAGRAVQGLGGGGIVILVNICVGDLFSLRYGHDILWYSSSDNKQRSESVLWYHWCSMGHCERTWSCARRRVHREA
jgi:hypothetical protein